MLAWLMLGGAILLEVLATLSLKASEGLTRWPWIIPVAGGYLGAFVLLSQVLRLGMRVGAAYATWAGAGVALTALLAWVVFGERLTWTMAAGLALIVVGVALVELGGSPEGHALAAIDVAAPRR